MDFDVIVLPYITPHPLVNKAPADIFVMSLLRDCPYGAAIGTFHARSLSVKEAIIASPPIRLWGWLQGEICDDAATTHCLPLGRNQSIGEAEGPEPGGIKGMAFRPVGCMANAAILQRGEEGALKRGQG